MKKINYRQKLINKIDELLQKTADSYCAYKNSVNAFEEDLFLFLDKENTERTTIFAKDIYANLEQVNLLLEILFDQEFIRVWSVKDLIYYSKTKKKKICYVITNPFMKTGWQTEKIYKFYNAKTGELEEIK